MASLLPDLLQKSDGSFVETKTALAGKDYIFFYFSASWCGPCRSFTPKVNEFIAAHGASKKVAAVLVPGDRSEGEALAYLGHLPAADLMIPFESPEIQALNTKYKVRGIPTLVLVDKDGKTITEDGREALMGDQSGAKFPWKPRTVWEVLEAAGHVVDKAGAKTPVSELRRLEHGIGLYFSAHWCPPCRGFTPELAKWYSERVTGAGKFAGKMDIVFVSSDRDEASFREYLGEMPWKALAFDQRGAKAELSSIFKVQGIPTLVFIDKEGNLVTADGRSKVSSDPDGYPWPPKPYDSLEDATDYINDTAVAVLFTDKLTDAAVEVAATEAMQKVAGELFVDGKPSEDIRFAIAGESDGAVDSVRSFLGSGHMRDADGPAAVRLTILDVPNGKKYMWNGGKLAVPTEDDIRSFISSFLAGAAPSVGIRE